jgi:hypothetical protein
MKKLIFMALLLSVTRVGYAQDEYLELLRSDVKTQRVAIITEVMGLQGAQADKFWEVYRDYEYQGSKIGDQRLALIKDYAAAYETMTDDKATELMTRSFDIDQQRMALRKEYYQKFEEAVGPITAAKFMQVDNQLNLLIDLQISQSLPLVREGMKHEGHDGM